MARDIPAALEGEFEKPKANPFLAVKIALPDPVYAFTGRGLLSFADADGTVRSWIGAGDVASIDTIGESTDGSATGIKVALYDVPSEFRGDIAQQATRDALFEVYIGALDEAFQTVIATALIWKGRVAEYKINDSGTAISVEVSGESRAIDQRRPAIKRFTNEYQQRKYPGDRFFEYVPQMSEISVMWAQAEQGNSTIQLGGGPASGNNMGGFIGGGTVAS